MGFCTPRPEPMALPRGMTAAQPTSQSFLARMGSAFT